MSKWTETAIKCLQDEADAVLGLIARLDGDFDKAVREALDAGVAKDELIDRINKAAESGK